MVKRRIQSSIIALTILFAFVCIFVPIPIFGKVKPITDVEEKLENISEEEKKVLQELFTINQKIGELETEKEKMTKEINILQKQIGDLENEIEAKQEDYDLQLGILQQVLVDYQRGGPATYLEILLGADDLSTFLKSINTIKDISHNVNELLTSLEDGKKALQEEKLKLDDKAVQLEQKKQELMDNIHKNQQLQAEKEDYLNQLAEDKAYYAGQLDQLEALWSDCQQLFPKLAKELMNTINEGGFTLEELNVKFGFLNIEGYINEDTFNNVLKENSDLSDVRFHFKENQMVLEVPEEHLVLTGKLVITGESAISFEVEEGTFFDLPLEDASIGELFKNGPLLINFQTIAEGLLTIEFTVTKVECQEGKMAFDISPKW